MLIQFKKAILIFLFLIITVIIFAADRFTDNSNGTVKDNGTGLIWQKCTRGISGIDCTTGSASEIDWEGALSYCENLTIDGNLDWRLPNINELTSIIDFKKYNPAIDTGFFPGTMSSYYWSSSTYIDGITNAWIVQFNNGDRSVNDKMINYCVRCVSGP